MNISVTNQTGNVLTLSMITRAMIRLMRPFLLGREITFVPGETKTGLASGPSPLLRQRHVDFRMDAALLKSSLDDVSDKMLLSCARALGTNLMASDISSTYELALPQGYNACRANYDGISMRAIMTPLRYDPFTDYFVADKDCIEPEAYELRFDVLFSDQSVALSAALKPVEFGDEVKASQYNAMWDALVAAARAA